MFVSNANIPQSFVTMKMLQGQKHRLSLKTIVFYGLTKFKPRFHFSFFIHLSTVSLSVALQTPSYRNLPITAFGAQTHPQEHRLHVKPAPKLGIMNIPVWIGKIHCVALPFCLTFLFLLSGKSRGQREKAEQAKKSQPTASCYLPTGRQVATFKWWLF